MFENFKCKLCKGRLVELNWKTMVPYFPFILIIVFWYVIIKKQRVYQHFPKAWLQSCRAIIVFEHGVLYG